MNCDYCGQIIKLQEQNSNQNFSCQHDVDQFLEQIDQQEQKAQNLSLLVQKQLDKVKQIDQQFQNKMQMIFQQIQNIENEQRNNLRQKRNFLENFDVVFEHLKDIQIQDELKQYFKENIQDYFDQNQIFQWVNFCKKEIERIDNSLNNFQKEFLQEKQKKIEQFFQNIFQEKEQVEILLMTYNIFSEQKSMDKQKINSFINQFKIQHKNLLEFLLQKHQQKRVFQKQLKKLFQQHRTIQKDILEDFSQNFRVLESFDDFEVNFKECVQEMKTRNKFKFCYLKTLEILNQITQKENQRRILFIKKMSNKIPNQIFPFLKELVHQLNIAKISSSLDASLPKVDLKNETKTNTQTLTEQILNIFFNQNLSEKQTTIKRPKLAQKQKLQNFN